MVGQVSSILPGALVGVLRGYAELEAIPLVAPEVLTPIGFMFACTERPSHALRCALHLANDADWLRHAQAHSGMLQSTGRASVDKTP